MSAHIQTMLADCEEAKTCRNSPFSKWEEDFIDSVAEQFEERGTISEKQEVTLTKIWEKI